MIACNRVDTPSVRMIETSVVRFFTREITRRSTSTEARVTVMSAMRIASGSGRPALTSEMLPRPAIVA